MKPLGALLILSSGLFLGLHSAASLRRRVETLAALKRTVQSFRTGIAYCARPLGELIAETTDSPFCRLAAEENVFPADPGKALELAGEKLLRAPADLELYRHFVAGLGTTDTQGQLEHLSFYSALVETALTRAGEERDGKSRLCVTLGLFGGAAVCLVLL